MAIYKFYIEMKNKIILLLSISIWLFSCQQNEPDILIDDKKGTEEKVPVNISVGFDDLVFQTDYVPMKNGTDANEVKVMISKLYRIVLMKEVEDKIIIHSLLTGVTDENIRDWESSSYKAGESLKDIPLVLTPGKYYVTVFTGYTKLTENGNLKEGLIVADATKDGTETFAYTYGIGEKSYSNVGMKYIGQEIFTGHTNFTVKKTEDLHSNADKGLDSINITLNRCVTKYRIILHDTPDQEINNAFANNSSEAIIKAHFTATKGKFVDGLDIWGNPWYNPQTEMKEIPYCTETKSTMIPIGEDKYFFSTFGARINAPYFFSKEGDDVEVEISNIKVLFGSNSRYYQYYGPNLTAKLIHSNIDGIILKPGEYTTSTWPPITDLEIEMDDSGTNPRNPLEIFNSYGEYNFLTNP